MTRRPAGGRRPARPSVSSTAGRGAERSSLRRDARPGSRVGAGAVGVVLVLLAGCTPDVPVATPAPTHTDLVAARRAAGIADCPQPVGEPVTDGLPDLTLDCLGGDVTVPLAALRGPLLINLWAQWCLPCRQEAPVLAEFAAAREDVAVLGINYDDPEPDWAIEFARISGWAWPQLADPDKTIQASLGVPGIPISLLLDEEGRIAARHSGAFTDLDELTAWVDQGLAG